MTVEQKAEELWKKADKYVVTTGNNDCTIDAYIAGYHEGQKEHEWHYVKNGDLPRQDGNTCFSIEVLASNKKWVYYQFDNGKWFCGNKEVKVIAWQEIIPPKEIE